MKAKSLVEFTKQINDLFRASVGFHRDLPSHLFEDDFRSGMTARQVYRRLEAEAVAERRAEARMS